MEPLISYLSVFFVASLVVGFVLRKHPVTAVLLCPVISFVVYLVRRDWSDFDGLAIWATPGSTSSWVVGLSVDFILHATPSCFGALVGSVVGHLLIDRRPEHPPSS